MSASIAVTGCQNDAMPLNPRLRPYGQKHLQLTGVRSSTCDYGRHMNPIAQALDLGEEGVQ